MTLPSRHRIRNSNPEGLRPSTLPLSHGGSPQYCVLPVHGEETCLFFQTAIKMFQTKHLNYIVVCIAFLDNRLRLMKWSDVQRKRRRHFQDVCKRLNMTDKNEGDITRIPSTLLVDEKHKLMFCYIAKVACSSWKWLLIALQGKYDIDKSVGPEIHSVGFQRKNGILPLNDYSKKEIEYRLKNYKKVIAVRNPVSRLVSAYNSKFIPQVNERGRFVCHMCSSNGIKILEETRYKNTTLPPKYENTRRYTFDSNHKNYTWEDVEKANFGALVTLEEFLQWSTSQTTYDRHWKPFYQMCNPCGINYDYIVKMETIKDDSYFLMPLLWNSSVSFPDRNRAENKVSFGSASISDIPVYLQKNIVDTYDIDMKMFDYEYPWEM